MCGIAGIADAQRRVDPEVATRMAERLAHRGPDGAGLWVHPEARVALAHRRLAIIDLSQRAAQPMRNEGGTVRAVVNGELYNYRDLRRELEASGHRFSSDSDSEIVLHGHEEWGFEGLLARLRGMFAIALWDEARGELLLARDRLGIKPLYYGRLPGGGLVFASEARALLAHPAVSARLDPEGLSSYLAHGYVPHERCMFAGLAKLRPGHFARWRDGQLEVARWWEIQYRPDATIRDTGAAVEAVRAAVIDAVRLRLVADVPVGAFLSGGIDSSQCTAVARELSPAGLDTFCVGFNLPNEDDPRYARIVADHLGTRHHDLAVGEEDARRVVPDLASVFDEPLYDPSCLPTYILSGFARQRVKVALSGTGGDELFAGYGWFASQVAYARQRGRLGVLGDILAAVGGPAVRGLRALPYGARTAGLLKVLGRSHPERAFPIRGFFDATDQKRLLSGATRAAASGDDYLWLHRRTWRPDWPLIPAVLNHDLNSFLPDNCLTLLDRCTMAHGLEGRVPLIDHVLVERVLGLDWQLLSSGDGEKRLLKDVAAPWLPEPVMHRAKSGFSPPFKAWLRDDADNHFRGQVTRGRLVEDGIITPGYVDTMIARHEPRRWNKLWLLVILEHWYRRWIRDEAPPAAA